nr:stigma-specific stig1-like protein 3 [Quercus suber]
MSRNLKQFSNIDPDAMKARQNIQTRFNEIVKIFSSTTQPPKELSSKNWSPPPSDCIKLNADAATRSSGSALAVVPRNHLGEVLSIWAKKHHSSSPAIAEAESLYWAMNLAVKEGWKSVIFEGDAKNCFDPLINLDLSPEWLTHNIISMAIVAALDLEDYNKDMDMQSQVTVPENQEQEAASLRGVGRFLSQYHQPAKMTCNKFPRVCRLKNSPGRDCCNKKCVNVITDRMNCGACGRKCKYSEICCKGKCVNTSFDKRHCGGCNKKCKKGELCVYGMCNYA